MQSGRFDTGWPVLAPGVMGLRAAGRRGRLGSRLENDALLRGTGAAQAALHSSRMVRGRPCCAGATRGPGRRPYPLLDAGDKAGRGSTAVASRVVTLDDGETVHNAFFDRNFPEEQP
jgi:hypothetical protein